MKKETLLREAAFILIFEKNFNPEKDCDEIISEAKTADIFDFDNGVSDEDSFDSVSAAVFKGVCGREAEFDGIISKYSDKRRIDRIPKLCLSILRLALYEILYSENVPTNVAISEAVGLAMIYGTDSDVRFINGVLGKYADDMEENS